MKLMTHNILMCNRKNCNTNNFPLKLVANKVSDLEGEEVMTYNKALMQRMLDKIEW